MVPSTLLPHGISGVHLDYATANLYIYYSGRTEYGKEPAKMDSSLHRVIRNKYYYRTNSD